IPVQVPHVRHRPDPVRRRNQPASRRPVQSAFYQAGARLPAWTAVHQERFCRLSGLVPAQHQVHTDQLRRRSPGRNRNRDLRAVAAYDFVRGPCAGNRQRNLLSAHGDAGERQRRPSEAARKDPDDPARSDAVRSAHRGLRHPKAIFEVLAGRSAADLASRAAREPGWHQQRAVRVHTAINPTGNDGTRVPAGLSIARTALAGLADVRFRDVGQGVPRRPGDRAVGRLRNGCVFARLRPVLLQAFRRRAPRLGRSGPVGRTTDRAYEALRVDPRTKTLVFSDALTFGRAVALYRRFNGRARIAFGVGTNLTNDLGYTPLQIVIKMVRCNGQPVAKVTDSPEKNLSDDPAYLAYLKQVFQIQ